MKDTKFIIVKNSQGKLSIAPEGEELPKGWEQLKSEKSGTEDEIFQKIAELQKPSP